MGHFLNKVSGAAAVCFLILFQITATLCLYDKDFNSELYVNNLSTLSGYYFEEEISGGWRYDKVIITDNNFTSLEKETFNSLSGMKILEINRNPLTSLPETIFVGTPGLRTLDLGDNQLSSMPSTIFNELPDLENLDLGGNQLKSLPADLFAGRTKLENLFFGENQLTSLPANIFQDLRNLTSLAFHSNQITTLSEDLFVNLHELWNLGISDNNFTTLPENIFKNQHKLEYLHLDGNQLTSLPANVFQSLERLSVLFLGRNQLSTLPEDIFNGLYRMTSLRMNGNRVTTLPANIFKNNSKLYDWQMGQNQLTSLSEDIFEPLTKLRELDVSGNQLTNLSENIFQHQTDLRLLNFGQNQLTELPENIFQRQDDLMAVNLSGNKLKTLPRNIFNKRKYLLNPDEFPKWSFLYSRSQCDTNLNGNPWLCDNDFMEIVSSLKSADIDELVCGDGQLIGYKFGSNEFAHICPSECDCRLMNKGTTFEFNCSNRDLTNIPYDLGKETQDIPKVQNIVLNLDNNNILSLPNLVKLGLEDITKITARNNSIFSLNVDRLPINLKEIDLNENQLESLSSSAMEKLNYLPSLQKISFAKNPWKCNDDFVDFARFNSKIVDFESITCPDGEFLMQKINQIYYWIQSDYENDVKPLWTNWGEMNIRYLKHDGELGQICPTECECLIAHQNTTIMYQCPGASQTRAYNHFDLGRVHWPLLNKLPIFF